MKKILYILLFVILYSCSSEHEIYINKNNSANVKFNIENKNSLIETLKEWGKVQNSEDKPLIDTEQVKKDLSSNRSISKVVIETPSPNKYKGNFFISNIENLFNDASKEIPDNLQIFSISENKSTKKLQIQLSLENYKYLKETLPVLQEESIEMLGPDANQDVSKEEYLDMMSFSLGDEGPKDIISSYINLKIIVDGIISNVEGGKLQNKNTAVFKVPLIDIILLKKTLIYSISYS